MNDKTRLRRRLRALRRDYVSNLPESVRHLIFLRPPQPITDLIPSGATIGLYDALPSEAPTLAYAKWFYEEGHSLALPWFAQRDAPMRYREWRNPYEPDELQAGPFRMRQPPPLAREVKPDLVFVPLIGFTAQGERLGQGGGHFDRWLAAHSEALAIGLAWDCQLVEELPVETHDRPLHAIVTPTRLFETED